jgi:hypothetical protein
MLYVLNYTDLKMQIYEIKTIFSTKIVIFLSKKFYWRYFASRISSMDF